MKNNKIKKIFSIKKDEIVHCINFSKFDSKRITEFYIPSINNKIKVEEVEEDIGYQCYIHLIKQNGQELCSIIPYVIFSNMIKDKMYEGKIYKYDKYIIPLGKNNLLAELRIYSQDFFGKNYVIVEFDSLKDFEKFNKNKPIWFNKEILDLEKFLNE